MPAEYPYAEQNERVMPLVNELIVTVVGGVVTALILEMFRGRRRRVETKVHAQHSAARRGSVIGQFVHMLLAVIGGIAFAIVGGRWLIQTGVLDGSLRRCDWFCWLAARPFVGCCY